MQSIDVSICIRSVSLPPSSTATVDLDRVEENCESGVESLTTASARSLDYIVPRSDDQRDLLFELAHAHITPAMLASDAVCQLRTPAEVTRLVAGTPPPHPPPPPPPPPS